MGGAAAAGADALSASEVGCAVAHFVIGVGAGADTVAGAAGCSALALAIAPARYERVSVGFAAAAVAA